MKTTIYFRWLIIFIMSEPNNDASMKNSEC